MKLISFSRDELAAGMRKHSKDPIHDPLTEINEPKQVKAAKAMFKNILGFMGDRQIPGPLVLAQELSQFCLNEPWIRAEIYCQLIKQVTANPNPDSLAKGWWLMAICLETFPPPPEFENYLEIFLREKSPPGQQERFVRMLHLTVYGGQRHAPLSESEMSQVQAGQSLRAGAFENQAAYQTPVAPLPQRAAPQPIMGVVPLVAGGAGMAGYNPHAAAVPPPAQAAAALPPQPAAYPPQAAAYPPPAAEALPPPPPTDPMPPPPPPPAAQCLWEKVMDPSSGLPYYFHTQTNETTWDRPADFFE